MVVSELYNDTKIVKIRHIFQKLEPKQILRIIIAHPVQFSKSILAGRKFSKSKRKEYRLLSDDERKQFHSALNHMKNKSRLLVNNFF